MNKGYFKDNFYYLEDLNDIDKGHFKQVSNDNVPESTVDSKCVEIFKDMGFLDEEIRQQSTRIKFIDKNILSKNNNPNERGYADVYIVQNEQLKVLIEDKAPNISVEEALKEAIFYCNALRKKGIDIRIAIGYNGKEILFRVFIGCDKEGNNIWSPFYFNGKEYKNFPSKDIISLIYKYKYLHGILEDKSPKSKKIVHSSIEKLRNIYRQLPFIQNNNTNTIDFTIAFISLKSISEKYAYLFEDSSYIWDNLLPNGENETTSDPRIKLQNNISGLVEWICDKEKQENEFEERESLGIKPNVNLYNFHEIFQYKTKDRNFNFKTLINSFNRTNLDKLEEIYKIIDNMPELHSSKIDLFGEVYELLADKKTKKSFGQFFTGRHIIKPLIRLLFEETESIYYITGEIKNGIANNPKKICDPACGTGGFLTEAFKYIENTLKEKGVTIDMNDFASKAFYGFDIYSQNIVKTKINMYLAGDGFSEIKVKNSLLDMQKYMEYFDYIITNPPYGDNSPVIDASIINSQRLEINFIIQIVKMLKVGGKGLIIIPDGVLESPSVSHFREWLLRQCKIDKIIGLPKFAFAPYTKEKTYSLFITKRAEPINGDIEQIRNEEIWFYIVDNDGFANSDKRFPTNLKDENGKWLHNELSPWIDNNGIEHKSMIEEAWKKKDQEEDEEFFDEWGNKIEGKKYGRIKLKEIFKNEFVYYPTVRKNRIKQIINKLPNIDDLPNEELEKINVIRKENKYFDLTEPKHKYLTLSEIKELFNNIKTKKDLITEEGKIIDDFILNEDYDYEIKEIKSGFTINIWKKSEDTYKEISKQNVINRYKQYLSRNGEFIDDLKELIDEKGNLKEKFARIFEENNIYYDIEDDKFYDHSQRKTKKLLYLIPEKYFREKQIETIDLETFKKESDILIKNIKKELDELFKGF